MNAPFPTETTPHIWYLYAMDRPFWFGCKGVLTNHDCDFIQWVSPGPHDTYREAVAVEHPIPERLVRAWGLTLVETNRGRLHAQIEHVETTRRCKQCGAGIVISEGSIGYKLLQVRAKVLCDACARAVAAVLVRQHEIRDAAKGEVSLVS